MRRVLFFALAAAGLVLAVGLFEYKQIHDKSATSVELSEIKKERSADLEHQLEYQRAQRTPQPSPPQKEKLASSESFISCQAGGTTAPSFFPWPPLQGSGEQDFTEPVVSAIRHTVRGPIRLKSVDLFLRDRLRRVGHSSFTYFGTPQRDGYVAVTRLEQIDETGYPLKGSARFSKDAVESGSFIYNFVKELVSLPEGRFRLLVFFVSSDPVATEHTAGEVTLKLADRWVGEGCGSLPLQLAELRLTDSHRILLRVYEFFGKGSDLHLTSKANAIPLAQHLSALGLKLDDQTK
jgi:hypothetical protein